MFGASSAFLILILTILQLELFKVPKIILKVTCVLALCVTLYASILKKSKPM